MRRWLTSLGILLICGAAGAQTLARPGWVGSGLKAEPWWKHAVIYEVYPRSFQDSDGDGVGDLKGITSRLDYLQHLGVDAIWLTPIYPSPQVDFGYDISDYTAIDPQYGTMEDFDALVAEASKRHIKVLMDFVMNHTSDKHPWFLESAKSKESAKRDWYVWRDGKVGADGKMGPPNNWQSLFGHSAWKYDNVTKQYYYHFFYAEQPDLNWRNPAVKKAMFDAVRFWLARGVAGFRLDAITTLYEDPGLKDAREMPGTNAFGDPNPDFTLQSGLPEVHDVMRELRRVTDSVTGQRVLIGEIYTGKIEELASWYGRRNDELQMPMDTQVGLSDDYRLDAGVMRRKIEESQTKLGGNVPLLVFDNHDQARSWDRFGDDAHRLAVAKVIATVLLGTRDAALMYYGQEIGMATTVPARKEDVKDPMGIVGWPKEKGRDGERTPMQWDAGVDAGFSTAAKTWLPVPASAKTVNVAAEESDDASLLRWYEQMIALRKSSPALRSGTMTMIDRDAQHSLVWVRRVKGAGPVVVMACNFSAEPVELSLRSDLGRMGVRGSYLRGMMRSDGGMGPMNLEHVRLPAYGVFVGEVGR